MSPLGSHHIWLFGVEYREVYRYLKMDKVDGGW
jgi:hypothetical protein